MPEQITRLMTGQSITIHTDTGRYEVTATAEGVRVSARDGGRLLTAPTGCHNEVDLTPWPAFQPLIPPTSEQPVQVSRDLVMEVMAPRANGVSSEVVAAVQDAVDNTLGFRSMLEGIIHQTLTKQTSPGYSYETVYVRGTEPTPR